MVFFFLGQFNGEATVTYVDPAVASYAVTWFNGKDFNGCKIKVQMAPGPKPKIHGDGSYTGKC